MSNVASMPTFIDEMYDTHEKLKEFTSSVFFMRVGQDDQSYIAKVTVSKVSQLMVRFHVEPYYCALKEDEIKCVLSVNEFGIPFDLPIEKLDQKMLARITEYENMKGDEQRRRYRKKCSTFIREQSRMQYIKEALTCVHKKIYVIVTRTKTKASDVRWQITQRPLVI
jgi:hypothetical protein